MSLNTKVITINEIESLDLEISSNCVASCPMCPRNFHGMRHNAGYPVTHISKEDFQRIFDPQFMEGIRLVKFNGNFGDFNMNPDAIDIVSYIRRHSIRCEIEIHTNGSSRNTEFWQSLAQYDPILHFDIDGLEDTHTLHRIGTNYETIFQNAKAFIGAGGRAVWKMLVFDHNRHQLSICKSKAHSMGFMGFSSPNDGRDDSYVFDKKGTYSHVIGKPKHGHPGDAQTLMKWKKQYAADNNHYKDTSVKKKISCKAIKDKRIYMAANGEIFPCCWLGFYPRTFDHELLQGNDQVKELLMNAKNNAVEHGLGTAMEWFADIEKSWKRNSFHEGRLFRCNMYCGQD